MSSLFERRNIESYTDSLAGYLPGGDLFASKQVPDSKLRKLLRGLSWEMFRSNGLLREYNAEIIPDQTNKFLGEWESAVGIPDCCFTGTGTADERRRDILVKLASLGVQTTEDFIDLAKIFGVGVSISNGIDGITFPLTFPVLMFTALREARFTIVVTFTIQEDSTFPLAFPIAFGSGEIALLECLFRKVKPANCDIIFKQVA